MHRWFIALPGAKHVCHVIYHMEVRPYVWISPVRPRAILYSNISSVSMISLPLAAHFITAHSFYSLCTVPLRELHDGRAKG